MIVDLVRAMTHTDHALWSRHPRVKVQEPARPRREHHHAAGGGELALGLSHADACNSTMRRFHETCTLRLRAAPPCPSPLEPPSPRLLSEHTAARYISAARATPAVGAESDVPSRSAERCGRLAANGPHRKWPTRPSASRPNSGPSSHPDCWNCSRCELPRARAEFGG